MNSGSGALGSSRLAITGSRVSEANGLSILADSESHSCRVVLPGSVVHQVTLRLL